MRVILKPAGLVIVFLLLSLMIGLASLRVKQVKLEKLALAKEVLAEEAPAPATPPTTTLGKLKNADFEGAFLALGPPNSPKAGFESSGQVADTWTDNSSWSNVTVEYKPHTQNPHSGKQCQQVRLVAKREVDGQAQFVSILPLELGATYRATAWVRASRPNTTVALLLRSIDGTTYGETPPNTVIGTKWQKLTATGRIVGGGNNTFFMVNFSQPGITVWIDDATLEKISDDAKGAK